MEKRPERLTREEREEFLSALARTGLPGLAAESAGVALARARQERGRNRDFAGKWDEIEETAADRLEAEARRRALEGVSESHYYGGKPIGEIRKYSDSLLALLLKGNRPGKFGVPKARDGDEKSPSADQDALLKFLNDEELEQLSSLLKAAHERAAASGARAEEKDFSSPEPDPS